MDKRSTIKVSTHLDEAAQTLRERILAGRFNGGERLREQALSDELDVSRTVVRLALGELEKDGLVRREPNRGYRIRSFTIAEVADAIMVRGELEGMAARLCAERGLDRSRLHELSGLTEEMDAALTRGFGTVEARAQWIEWNGRFHHMLIESSGNAAIVETVAGLSRLPLVAARALVFDQVDPQMSRASVATAHQDHKAVLDAIANRQGQRAANIMREHAYKSAQNKRLSFASMRSEAQSPPLPGLTLVHG